MRTPSRRPRGHAARALEEALGAIAAPAVCDAILASALARAGAVTLPDGEALVVFVRGALRSSIAERLGEDVAAEVLTSLSPLIQQIAQRKSLRPRSSGPVPTGRSSSETQDAVPPSALRRGTPATPTARPGPPATSAKPLVPRPSATAAIDEEPSGVVTVRQGKTVRAGEFLPVILVVTRAVEWTRDLGEALVGRAVVRRVAEIFEMVEAVEDHRADLPVVLFDCPNAPFHLESVATFASELPPGSWLALRGATPSDERTARGFAGSTLTLARIGLDDTIAAISERCLSLSR